MNPTPPVRLVRGYFIVRRFLKRQAELLLLPFTVLLLAQSATAQEWETEFAIAPLEAGAITLNDFLDHAGAPLVRLTRDCENSRCRYLLVNGQGETLRSYSDRSGRRSVSVQASLRSVDEAAVLVRISERRGKDRVVEHWRINARGQRLRYRVTPKDNALAEALLPNGDWIQVTSAGVYRLTSEGTIGMTQSFEESARDAALSVSPEGRVALSVRDSRGRILGCDLTRCLDSGLNLDSNTDTSGVLSAYSDRAGRLHLATYYYINAFNKGVYGAEIDLDTDQVTSGWIVNSESRNLGFDPQLAVLDGQVVVSAQNASQNEHFHITYPTETWAGALEPHLMTNPNLAHQRIVELRASAGVWWQYNQRWNRLSTVEENDTRFRSRYDLEPGLANLFALEGRIGNHFLALSFLQRRDENLARIGRLLSLVYDIHNLGRLSDHQTGLRLEFETVSLRGEATTESETDDDYAGFSTEINTENTRLGLKFTLERGEYYGLVYEQQQTPAWIGYTDWSGNYVSEDFVNDLTLRAVRFHIGYDQLAYTQRYETNYSRPYLSGDLGLGLAWSPDLPAYDDAAMESAGPQIERVMGRVKLAAEGSVDVGYQIQRRRADWYGAGLSFQVGYRARGNLIWMGQSENSDVDNDAIHRNFELYGIQHGPFATLGLIF